MRDNMDQHLEAWWSRNYHRYSLRTLQSLPIFHRFMQAVYPYTRSLGAVSESYSSEGPADVYQWQDSHTGRMERFKHDRETDQYTYEVTYREAKKEVKVETNRLEAREWGVIRKLFDSWELREEWRFDPPDRSYARFTIEDGVQRGMRCGVKGDGERWVEDIWTQTGESTLRKTYERPGSSGGESLATQKDHSWGSMWWSTPEGFEEKRWEEVPNRKWGHAAGHCGPAKKWEHDYDFSDQRKWETRLSTRLGVTTGYRYRQNGTSWHKDEWEGTQVFEQGAEEAELLAAQNQLKLASLWAKLRFELRENAFVLEGLRSGDKEIEDLIRAVKAKTEDLPDTDKLSNEGIFAVIDQIADLTSQTNTHLKRILGEKGERTSVDREETIRSTEESMSMDTGRDSLTGETQVQPQEAVFLKMIAELREAKERNQLLSDRLEAAERETDRKNAGKHIGKSEANRSESAQTEERKVPVTTRSSQTEAKKQGAVQVPPLNIKPPATEPSQSSPRFLSPKVSPRAAESLSTGSPKAKSQDLTAAKGLVPRNPRGSPAASPNTSPRASPKASPSASPTASPRLSPNPDPQLPPEAGSQKSPRDMVTINSNLIKQVAKLRAELTAVRKAAGLPEPEGEEEDEDYIALAAASERDFERAERLLRSETMDVMEHNILLDSMKKSESPDKLLTNLNLFKFLEELMDRKLEVDKADLSARRKPRTMTEFLMEHLTRQFGIKSLALKFLSQLMPSLLALVNEEHKHAVLYARILQVFHPRPIPFQLALVIVRIRPEFHKLVEKCTKEREARDSKRGMKREEKAGKSGIQAAMDLLATGGEAFVADVMMFLYEFFDNDKESGELALQLLRPSSVSLAEFVLFKICHKMAKMGLTEEALFSLIDLDGGGTIDKEEFVEGVRSSLDLWITREHVVEVFNTLTEGQAEMTREAFLSRCNFTWYQVAVKSDDFIISKCDFMEMVINVYEFRQKRDIAGLVALFRSQNEDPILEATFRRIMRSLQRKIPAARVDRIWRIGLSLRASQEGLDEDTFLKVMLRYRTGQFAATRFCKD